MVGKTENFPVLADRCEHDGEPRRRLDLHDACPGRARRTCTARRCRPTPGRARADRPRRYGRRRPRGRVAASVSSSRRGSLPLAKRQPCADRTPAPPRSTSARAVGRAGVGRQLGHDFGVADEEPARTGPHGLPGLAVTRRAQPDERNRDRAGARQSRSPAASPLASTENPVTAGSSLRRLVQAPTVVYGWSAPCSTYWNDAL